MLNTMAIKPKMIEIIMTKATLDKSNSIHFLQLVVPNNVMIKRYNMQSNLSFCFIFNGLNN